MITVVKINSRRDNFTRYIGRAWAEFPESVFHNRFHIGKDGDRVDVIIEYALWWFAPEQKWLRDFALAPVNIPDDSIFGCWCHPKLCHGDIVAGYINWKRHQYVEFRQREALRKRLVGRKKPSREVFEEIGAPRLFE